MVQIGLGHVELVEVGEEGADGWIHVRHARLVPGIHVLPGARD